MEGNFSYETTKMNVLEDSNKRNAVIGVVVFHVLMLLLFLFTGLRQPDPEPEDETMFIAMDFGNTDEGSGDVESEVVSEQNTESEETATTTNTTTEAETQEVAEQETESVAVNTSDSDQEEETQEEENQISSELQNALDLLNNPSGGNSEGDSDNATGNQGNPNGDTGKGVLGGGDGDWSLANRLLLEPPRITDKTQEEGKVVLNIYVDRKGKVTRVTPNLSKSTTTNQELFDIAKKAAMRAKFNADSDAAIEQKGTMTFNFVLK